MIALSTRSFCDECGRSAVVQIGVVFFCEICVPCEAGEASAADIPAPGRLPAADAPLSVNTAVTETLASREKVSGKTTNRELLAPRLCRESGGVTPTAQTTRADGSKRDEVQVSAPSAMGGGKPSANSNPVHGLFFPPVPETCGAPTTAASPFSSEVPVPVSRDRQAVAASTSTADAATVDPGMSGFNLDFEYEVASLEARWARDGICMKTTTFLVSVASDNISKSVSVGV